MISLLTDDQKQIHALILCIVCELYITEYVIWIQLAPGPLGVTNCQKAGALPHKHTHYRYLHRGYGTTATDIW